MFIPSVVTSRTTITNMRSPGGFPTGGAPVIGDNTYRRYIWPLENEFDFDLSLFRTSS